MDLVKALNSQYMKEQLPEAKVGDTVRVHVRIREGSRERIQVFEGTIIARKNGGIGETITVRRISYGVGCEKVFPVHSPRIAAVRHIYIALYYRLVYPWERNGKNLKKASISEKFLLIFQIYCAIIHRSEIKVSPLRGREPYRRSNRRMNA